MSNIQPWQNQNIQSDSHAAKIIKVNLPKLKINNIKLLGQGWDNTTWLINNNLCFRFPKHAEAAELLTNEIKILSNCIQTSIATPAPERIILSPKLFEYPFYSHKYISGLTADRANLDDKHRIAITEKLAIFLKELHSFPISKCIDLGVQKDQLNRLDFKKRYPEFNQRINYLIAKNLLAKDSKLKEFYQENMQINIPDSSVLCHGDLYPKHLIINDNSLYGIIDWGDSELIHPAIDLAIVYQFLPQQAHSKFWDIYGSIDSQVHTIAILRAIYSSTTICWYADQVNDTYLLKEGITGLNLINKIIR